MSKDLAPPPLADVGHSPASPAAPGAPSRGGRRRLDVQGLRAVAVLMVVAFHAGLPVPGGFVGVDVFFVISGFVIAAMLQREWAGTGRIRFAAFYIRRFKRLTPALAVMVSFTMLMSVLLLSPFGAQQVAGQTAIGTMFLSANAVIARVSGGYFDVAAGANPLLNTWSLSVEEQFYIAFPLILAVGWLLARRSVRLKSVPYVFVAVVAVISFGLAVLGSTGYLAPRGDWLIHFYSPLTRAWEFAVGAALALAATRLTLTSRSAALALGGLGAVLLGASLWLITGATAFPGPWTLLPVAGAALVILAGTQDANPVTRALATRPMVRIGDWSYSIYLWHWPLIVFAALLWPHNPLAPALAALLSFAPAIASYVWVEQPIRALVPRSRPRFAALVVVTVVPPLALAWVLGMGARAQWWMDWPATAKAVAADHLAMSHGCTDQPFNPVLCTWDKGAPHGKVLLAGDSQAYAAADGVIAADTRLGMSTTVTSQSRCPLSTVDTAKASYACPGWQKQVLDYALSTRPDVVVIANRSSGYARPDSGGGPAGDATQAAVASATGSGGAAGTVSAADVASASLYASGLNNVVRTLRLAGVGVVVLQGIPEPARVENDTSILRRFFPIATPGTFDPAASIASHLPWAGAEAAVVTANRGTVLYNPVPALCPSGTCPLVEKGVSVYLDTDHLTREGSLLLTTSLGVAIKKAAAAH